MDIRKGSVLLGPSDADMDADAVASVLDAPARRVRIADKSDAVGRVTKTVRQPECQNCDWRQATGYAQCGHPVVRCLLTGNGHRLHDVCTDWERQR